MKRSNTIISDENFDPICDEMWDDVDDSLTKPNCIFCERIQLKRKGSHQNTKRAESNFKKDRIREILQIENCTAKLCRIQQATSISYHPSCLTEYEHKLFYGQRANKRSDASPIESWALRVSRHFIGDSQKICR